jgi:hypothetical protein
MHGHANTLLRTIFAATLLTGCRDVTAPSRSPRSAPGFNRSSEHASAVAMPCNVSVQSTRGAGWTASRTSVTFPVTTLSPENRTTIFFVRGYNDRREVTAVAACVIPATPAAVEWIGRVFKVTKVKRGFDSSADGVTVMSGEPAYALAPLVATACSPGYTGDYPDCQPVGDGETTVSPSGGSTTWGSGTTTGGGGSGTGTSTGSTGPETGTADGYDSDPPPPQGEDESRNCPTLLSGKVITAGIPVSGILHTFKFDGPMARISTAPSPARYEISHPTVSEDSWWIAEAGWITVLCNGVYSPNAFGFRLWIGTASYAGQSDLHMVLGPNHPTSY